MVVKRNMSRFGWASTVPQCAGPGEEAYIHYHVKDNDHDLVRNEYWYGLQNTGYQADYSTAHTGHTSDS